MPLSCGLRLLKLQAPPVKTFLGQVPAEHGSLTRDHTQPTKAYSHLFIIVSAFQRKKTFMASSAIFIWWLTCLFGLYFSCFSQSRIPNCFCCFFRWCLVHGCSLPHAHSWHKWGSSMAVILVSPELLRSWLFCLSRGPSTSRALASLTTQTEHELPLFHSWVRPRIKHITLAGSLQCWEEAQESKSLKLFLH